MAAGAEFEWGGNACGHEGILGRFRFNGESARSATIDTPPSTNIPTALALPEIIVVDEALSDGERCFEIVNGKRVTKEMGLAQKDLAGELHLILGLFCKHHQLGRVMVETLFEIPGSDNSRIPDVAFMSAQKWAVKRPLPEANAWPIAPDLCVEITSPNDQAFDILEKVHEYFAGDVRQVWQVYSHVKQLWIYDSPSAVRILNHSDELAGDSIVPGLRMQVAELFPLMEPEA